jgi:glutathione gamma-glutamylcysteinyltransferase
MQRRCQQCARFATAAAAAAAAAAPSAFCTLQPFTSPAGRRLFMDSVAAAALHAYLPLAAQRCPQPSAALQGAATLTVVLNAMGVDPGRVWKWPWRWYAEAMLPPPAAACASLEDLAALARTQGLGARVAHAGAGAGGGACAALAGLRAAAQSTSTTPQGRQFAVVAYRREGVAGGAAAGGSGSGAHFSLVAGYHAAEDAVLLIDVHPARSEPSWVSLAALHAAMVQLEGPGGGCGGGFALLTAPAALE